ncbi:hypothetical protein P7C70_g3556, partial [Phenoliferia sp. Uapishka_3]
MIPIIIITAAEKSEKRRSLSLSSSSTGSLDVNLSPRVASTKFVPNWRDKLDTLSPPTRSSSPSRLRLNIVLLGCAAIILFVSFATSPFTTSPFDEVSFYRTSPVTDEFIRVTREQDEVDVRSLGRSSSSEVVRAPAATDNHHTSRQWSSRSLKHKEKAKKCKESKKEQAKKSKARKAAILKRKKKASKKSKKTVSQTVIKAVTVLTNSKSKSSSSSSNPKSSTSSTSSSSSYYTKTYSGVATHFPGSAAALACGDVYDYPETTKFAALCHTTFDAAPGTTSVTLLNPNKSPVCGAYVAGRKNLAGAWTSAAKTLDAYVTVGGDGAFSCVGTDGVLCHVPKTISVTRGGITVSGVQIVDRNQGLSPSPCSPGDVDVSDLVYLTLGDTSILGSELSDVTWKWE